MIAIRCCFVCEIVVARSSRSSAGITRVCSCLARTNNEEWCVGGSDVGGVERRGGAGGSSVGNGRTAVDGVAFCQGVWREVDVPVHEGMAANLGCVVVGVIDDFIQDAYLYFAFFFFIKSDKYWLLIFFIKSDSFSNINKKGA